MQQKPTLYLVLGCFGRSDDGFISCAGIENIILEIDQSLLNYDDILNYCEQYKLFDSSLMNYNAVRNFIFSMQDKFNNITKPLWSEKQFLLLQKFSIDHKQCGIFVRLSLHNNINTKTDKSKTDRVFIKGAE